MFFTALFPRGLEADLEESNTTIPCCAVDVHGWIKLYITHSFGLFIQLLDSAGSWVGIAALCILVG